MQCLLLLISTQYLEVLEIQISDHLLATFELSLNESLLSITTVISQSHFLVMTLKMFH